MGRDDSWPAMVPSVMPSLWYSLLEKAARKHPKWQNCTSNRESDGRFCIGKPGFLFEFSSNRASISLKFGDVANGRMDNVGHYYS